MSTSKSELSSSQENSGQNEVEFSQAVAEYVKVGKPDVVEAAEEDNAVPLLPTLKHNSSSGTSYPQGSSLLTTESVTRSFSSTPGYLANRWKSINSSLSTPPSSLGAATATPPVCVQNKPLIKSHC